MVSNFVHLRMHSEYSIVDGIVRIDDAIHTVKESGGIALGLTDLMNVFGALRFYTHAMAAGIKPIIGCDLWIENTQRGQRDEPYRITIFCQNHQGYLSLCSLLTRAWIENQYLGRGEVKPDWLTQKNCRGLICLSGGPLGLIERNLLRNKVDEARAWTTQLKAAFPDRLYCEVQRVNRKSDELCVSRMANWSIQEGLPLVATHPVQFMRASDFKAHEARVCIATGRVIPDASRPHDYTPEQYLKSAEEMEALFADLPQALGNTVVIAQRCNLDGVLQKPQLPLFPTPDGMSLDDYMVQLSHEGLERRLKFLYPNEAERNAKRKDYEERLEYELNTIIQMKFPGYFLIVQDFINWSKRNGVPVGPGRGSGAGSLVAYVLGITDLDPLHYGLLFERFLNPERVSMPDFDVDFCQHNRDRTIEYVKRTYGEDAVSQIVTFGAMGAKAVVRDVGRVLNMGYGKVDSLAKLIPQKPGQDITLAVAAEMEPDFKVLSEAEDYQELMTYARELEGVTRGTGMHAGGVLIAPGKLTDFCPLFNADGKPENTVSQFDKKDIENVGLVKFDFLGLTTLTILGKAVEYIDRLHRGTHFELERIPTVDAKTMELFQRGDTTAVFQFESEGMRDQLKKAHPDRLEDLVALNALYRPGPMDQIPHFIERKFGREKVVYLDPRMEPILGETYGIMVYQEQVMLVARAIAGYSLGGADLLRRAMSKKNAEEMKRQRVIFIKGAAERNVSEETAIAIFDLMENFAKYGFNKSHAAAYSYVAWQTAYLKAHHTACFVAGNLCLVMDQAEKTRVLIDDAREMGVTILPPDINVSEWFYTVPDENTIRFGLGAIRGMAQNVVEDVLEERYLNGPFIDIFDLAARVPSVNRKVLEQLVRSGAFDSIDTDRGKLMANVEQALKASVATQESVGQESLFADDAGVAERLVSWLPAERWGDKRIFAEEKEAFGFRLTGDPFAGFRQELRRIGTPIVELRPSKSAVTISGLVVDVRTIMGKRGKFAAVMVDDETQTQEVVLYSDVYERFHTILKVDEMLSFTGKVRLDERNGRLQFIVDSVRTLAEIRSAHGCTLTVHLSPSADVATVAKILENAQSEQNGVRCQVEVQGAAGKGQITLQNRYEPTDALSQRLRLIEGVEKVSWLYP